MLTAAARRFILLEEIFWQAAYTNHVSVGCGLKYMFRASPANARSSRETQPKLGPGSSYPEA